MKRKNIFKKLITKKYNQKKQNGLIVVLSIIVIPILILTKIFSTIEIASYIFIAGLIVFTTVRENRGKSKNKKNKA